MAGDTGRAEFDRAGRIIPLSKGVRLTEGDVLHTEGDKKVYLAVDNTTVLRLEENSEAAITRATFGQKLAVNLIKGRMFYNVAKQESGTESLELMSNNITIAVRGTSGILSVGNDRVQHQLYDGVVEVYEGDIKIAQVPGQMVETRVGPAQTLLISTDVKNFTLKDIPASVAQEMLADQNLMERILSSLPLGDMADRVMDILDGTFFKDLIESGNDKKVFEDTAKTKPDETYSPAPVPTTSETETETETETSTEETSETEPTQPTSPTETEPTQPTSPT
ncbi:MAG: FecR family protein [Lachnospiraceae bacterium]|nr:FecR family protein [Lachnospiraceae bacterium]